MKLYVTNIVTSWNEVKNRQTINLYGRADDGTSEVIEVHGFSDYFYAASDEIENAEQTLLSHENVDWFETDGYESLFGKRVGRVVLNDYYCKKEVASIFEDTYESDVFITNRFRIDTELFTGVQAPSRTCHVDEIEPIDFVTEPRILTFDIETDDRGAFPEPGERRIISISVHDSYSDEYHGFIDIEGRDVADVFPSGKPAGLDAQHYDSSEEQMLERFADWVSQYSFDIITGWNVEDFDCPYLLARMQKLGLSTDVLSREGYTTVTSRGNARIKGHSIHDMLLAYKMTKQNELRSFSLDAVAEEELGKTKLDHTGESIWEMYQDDCDKLMRYNLKDVSLVVQIEESAGVLGFKESLRNEVGVDLEETTANNQYIEMMARRKLHEISLVGPDATYEEKDEMYEGAYVFDAYTGVTENVVGVDLSSLYPYTMAMINASPESKTSGSGVTCPNEVTFDLESDGVFKQLIDDAIGLKSDYKKLRNQHEAGTPEYEKYAEKYSVSKTITNSCFTPDTEVMTPDGVVNIQDLSVGDVVYSIDPESGHVSQKRVEETQEFPNYRGELVDIKNGWIDFSVSPEHRMLVRRDTGYVDGEFEFVEAGDLYDSGTYRTPAGWSFTECDRQDTFDLLEYVSGGNVSVMTNTHGHTIRTDDRLANAEFDYTCNPFGRGEARNPRYNMSVKTYLETRDVWDEYGDDVYVQHDSEYKWVVTEYDMDDVVELLGWYISEGNTRRQGNNATVHIAQKEAGGGRPPIATLLERMGIDATESYNGYTFTSREWVDTLDNLCGVGSENKRIPDFVWSLSSEQKEILFETLNLGDGTKGSNRYTTKSDQLRDDVMELAVHLGYLPKYTQDSGVWRVHFRDDEPGFRMHRNGSTSQAENGIYCVTVEDNHTLLAGRNGRFNFVGNCYGVAGWSRFFLYDEEVAEAVTLMGQTVIKATQKYINRETLGEVIYGDTDSNYVRFPEAWSKEQCLDEARKITDELNEQVYPDLAEEYGIPREDCLWNIEVEAYMERYFQAGQKKFYAYLCTWKDGRDCKPKISIAGFGSQRSDSSLLTKELQEEVLEMILNGSSTEEIGKRVYEAAVSITPVNPDWERLGIPGGLGKELSNYTWTDGSPQGAHPRAAFFANEINDTDYGGGSKPMRVYLEETAPPVEGWEYGPINVLAFEENEQMPSWARLDADRMTETLITKPMDKILSAMDIEVAAAMKGQTQTGISAFL